MTKRSIRFRFAVVLAVALACLLTQGAWAKVYYVAPNGVDDLAGGTKAAPWKSINYGDANSLLHPGDTVIVMEGTYIQDTVAKGTLKNCSGTANAPITYVAQGHVVIDGMGTAGSTYATIGIGVTTNGIDYLVFDGFEVKGGKRCINIKGSASDPCIGHVIRNCVLHDCWGGYMMQNQQMGDCKIYRNLWYITDGLTGATTNRAMSTATTLYGNKIWHNTYYIGGGTATPRGGIFFTAPSTMADPAKMGTDEFTNNILWHKELATGVWAIWTYVTPAIDPDPTWFGVPLTHWNNMYWSAGTQWPPAKVALRFQWAIKPYPDADLWDNDPFAEGYGDPLFADQASGNFSLSTGSVCIDAGKNIGFGYYGAAPDEGAIETMPADAVITSKIADIASQPDGKAVKLSKCVVTVPGGVFKDGIFYVEDETRTAGIAVKYDTPTFLEGQRVEVVGSMGTTADGQRILNAFSANLLAGEGGAIAEDTPLKPVGMTGASIYKYLPDKQGMLVTIWGKVTWSFGTAYLSAYDGSGTLDGDAIGNAGIPVYTNDLVTSVASLPEANKYVAVTGVVGKATPIYLPGIAIRPRSAADIRVIN